MKIIVIICDTNRIKIYAKIYAYPFRGKALPLKKIMICLNDTRINTQIYLGIEKTAIFSHTQ